MALNGLLSGIQINLIGSLGSVSYKYAWLLGVIESFIGIVADVGLGIILFTLALKLITLPLDIFSRASMKKNALKMEMMRDDLEKLQKQYANNKQLYQQKMMALYKKNGYSALMPCLPTIISLVFFIIVIGAFSSYSRKADFEVFKKMATAYDEAIVNYDGDGIVKVGEDYFVNIDAALKEKYGIYFTGYSADGKKTNIEEYSLKKDEYVNNSTLKTDEKYAEIYTKFITASKDYNFADTDLRNHVLQITKDAFVRQKLLPYIEELQKDNPLVTGNADSGYFFKDSDIANIKAKTSADIFDGYVTAEGEFLFPTDGNKSEVLLNSAGKTKDEIANAYLTNVLLSKIAEDYADGAIYESAREASKKSYERHRSKSVLFPWVKNLWVVDSPTKPAIPTYANLSSTIFGKANSTQFTEAKYNAMTANLSAYKKTGFGKGNGLFILVALSILTMLASTLIMNKTQKTQMELSSVDGANGQAATQQKIMTWMMPIMFGVFAFIYSAGFSIYMVTSSILSTVFTLLINFCVEKSFKRKINKKIAEETSKARYGKRR